jgi:hypothetical protein
MTEVPTPATVRVEPETLMTDVVADAYVKPPGSEPVTVGGVTVNGESPTVLETLLQEEKVGVALPMVRVSVTSAAAE